MPFYNISLSLIDNLDYFSQNEKRILFDKETYITCYLEARSKNSVRKRMRRVTSHGRKKGEIFLNGSRYHLQVGFTVDWSAQERAGRVNAS